MTVDNSKAISKPFTKDEAWKIVNEIRLKASNASAAIGLLIAKWFDGKGPDAIDKNVCHENPYKWIGEQFGVAESTARKMEHFGRLGKLLGPYARKHWWLLERLTAGEKAEKKTPRVLLSERSLRPFYRLLPGPREPIDDTVAERIVETFQKIVSDAEQHAKDEHKNKPYLSEKSIAEAVDARMNTDNLHVVGPRSKGTASVREKESSRSNVRVIDTGTYTQQDDAPEGKRLVEISLEPLQAIADLIAQLDGAIDDYGSRSHRAADMVIHAKKLNGVVQAALLKRSHKQGTLL